MKDGHKLHLSKSASSVMHSLIQIVFLGDESSAVVEIAPFQGVPKEGRKRKDPKCGTITKGIYHSKQQSEDELTGCNKSKQGVSGLVGVFCL